MKLTSNIMRWWRTGNEQATITAPGDPKGDPFVVRAEKRWATGGGVILANVLIFAADAKDAKERVEASARLMIEEIEASIANRTANLRRIMASAPPETVEACIFRDCYNSDRHAKGLRDVLAALNGSSDGENLYLSSVEPLDRAGAYKVEWSTHMMGG